MQRRPLLQGHHSSPEAGTERRARWPRHCLRRAGEQLGHRAPHTGPHFGPLAIRDMFGEMHDIASQLAAKWARQGPEHAILVAKDFTRLTLDTIALCAMDCRFNSYYKESMHPFVEAMARFLKVSGDRARRSFATQLLCVSENQAYWSTIKSLHETSLALIKARKEHPSNKKDLLNGMLRGVDPETGEKMTVGTL
ncbi:hypothetical protein B5807_12110 [Epicoccum nigrum]|uniref:Uncharacterized protein n=1 Tax=Epicoccum nigrum TaxID=105696 RepID=A0A1Y2LJ80_EPING|nr:hypothetical protein B5807_12110 [Epicoccum nigrum]